MIYVNGRYIFKLLINKSYVKHNSHNRFAGHGFPIARPAAQNEITFIHSHISELQYRMSICKFDATLQQGEYKQKLEH
jgi:hypothetical protein